MRNIILLLLLSTTAFQLTAQKKSKPEEAFYVMDSNFQGTTIEKAQYMLHSIKKSDTCWQFDTYNMYGPMISSEQYKDEKASEANGSFFYYNKKGEVDSAGDFRNGFQDGTWYYFNDTGKVVIKKIFTMGNTTFAEDMLYKDTVKKTITPDTAHSHIEIESEFAGGFNQWGKYLMKNLVYPERAFKSTIQGKVVVLFEIDVDGQVLNPRISKSVEYSLDEEALRLIKTSPAWSPALRDGKKVKSYKKQPISFRLQ